MLTTTGTITVNTELTASTLTKKYDDILSFSVKDHLKIGEVKISLNPQQAGALDLAWMTIGGESKDYAIKYGRTQETLEAVTFTTEQKATLTGFSYGKSYFFQILATTPEHLPEGLPSQVIQFDLPILGGEGSLGSALTSSSLTTDEPLESTGTTLHPAAPVIVDQPTCVVKNIQFGTKKIGNKYYLTRNKVKNVEKYLVYRSDFADGSNKQFVGETEVPRFEYPFDTTAEEDIYAYYSVEAICTDGKKFVVANAEKVKVGPLEDMMLILACTFLFYLMYKLYTYRVD